jgi:hypothetical protein
MIVDKENNQVCIKDIGKADLERLRGLNPYLDEIVSMFDVKSGHDGIVNSLVLGCMGIQDGKEDHSTMSTPVRTASARVSKLVMPDSDLRIIFKKSDFKSKKGIRCAFKALADFFDTIRNNEHLQTFIVRTDDDQFMFVDFWTSDHEEKAAIIEALQKKGDKVLTQYRKI